MPAVTARHITKRYEDVLAVDDLSFEVQRGELFGFIGPDGAGKTTLFRILVTLLEPDAGEAYVNDLHVVDDYRRLRQQVGYMPGRFSLYQDLTVRENLEFFATIFHTSIEENYDLIKDIYQQIEPFSDRAAGALSGGMKQKLALSCALIHRPEILFLDEPTTGVDAVSRREFWEMLSDLQASGLTIIVSTPYMDEARQCDRVALMQDGQILNIDTPAALEAAYDRPLLAVKASGRHRLIQALRNYTHARSAFPFGESIHYTDAREETDIDELRRYLEHEGFEGIAIERIEAGIEDTFMALMNRKSDE